LCPFYHPHSRHGFGGTARIICDSHACGDPRPHATAKRVSLSLVQRRGGEAAEERQLLASTLHAANARNAALSDRVPIFTRTVSRRAARRARPIEPLRFLVRPRRRSSCRAGPVCSAGARSCGRCMHALTQPSNARFRRSPRSVGRERTAARCACWHRFTRFAIWKSAPSLCHSPPTPLSPHRPQYTHTQA
jgi:hypothetical protein